MTYPAPSATASLFDDAFTSIEEVAADSPRIRISSIDAENPTPAIEGQALFLLSAAKRARAALNFFEENGVRGKVEILLTVVRLDTGKNAGARLYVADKGEGEIEVSIEFPRLPSEKDETDAPHRLYVYAEPDTFGPDDEPIYPEEFSPEVVDRFVAALAGEAA